MKRIIGILIIAIGIVACETPKDALTQGEEIKKDGTNKEVTANQDIHLDPSDSLFASLRRGYCFGTCPVYTVEIFRSGYVEYSGQANVTMLGVYHGQLSEAQLQELSDIADDIQYSTFDTLYNHPPIADFPSITSSIVIGNVRKTVRRVTGYPKSIVLFEEAIDRCVEAITWTKKEPENEK